MKSRTSCAVGYGCVAPKPKNGFDPSLPRPRTTAPFQRFTSMLTKAEIQGLRSLRDKKEREATGRFVIEGEKVVAELIAEKFPFEEIYATPAWLGNGDANAPDLPSRRSAKFVSVSPDEM